MMDGWNGGALVGKSSMPSFHYSIIPIFHYSASPHSRVRNLSASFAAMTP
jgi:hypothetical protein